ncbi:MAG TPA: type II secretion system F family protein [Verrucomicrobiales bacterium]|nr:type II secretion system F family protein [Verrucomicrobiales bacterium]
MLKKVTLTNVNSGRSSQIVVDTDDDAKALVGCGKAPNEVAKITTVTGVDEKIHRLTGSKPSLDDRVNLFSGVARCLERNISTIKSFELQANRVKSPRYKGVVADIASQISQGEKVSDAMGRTPDLFGEAMLALVRAGEEAGRLPEVCNRIAKGQKKTLKILKKLKSGMIYPAIVLIIGVAVVITMSMTLVPSLKGLYAQFHSELPAATKLMMGLSNILLKQPYLVAIPIIGLVVLFKNWGKINAIPRVQRFWLKLPTVGNIVRKSSAAVSFRTLAMLIESNVRISTALRITGESAPNITHRDFFSAVQKHIEEGLSLHEAFLLESHLLGADGRSISGLMQLSSETGSSTDMLEEIADDYEEELDNIGNQIDKILEPITIICLGVMVGFLIYAIYSPIFSLGKVILPQTKAAVKGK